jgi:regulation of enolase protein 1 (concanavalin A-like superfamily)
MPGSTDYAPGSQSFYLDGSGADASGGTDQFHYTYQTLKGDGSIVARVRYQTESNSWVKAGVMIKASPSAGSAFVSALVTPDVSSNEPNLNGINCVFPSNAVGAGCDAPLPAATPSVGRGVMMQYNGGSQSVTSAAALAQFKSPNKWLKLQRTGNTFTSFYSSDGTHWTQIGSTSVSMGNTVTMGLFVTPKDARQYATAAFDSVSVNGGGGPPPPPPGCPTNWNCADIGNPTPAGSEALDTGTWTLQGGGSDIVGTSDQFHYDWQTGTGNVSAHVTQQGNTNAWAKTGVMVRADTSAGSAHFSVLITPGNGVFVEYRTTAGGGTTRTTAVSDTVPSYLRITRNGTTFTGEMSNNGSTWTTLGSQTIAALSGTVLEGLADTSHANGTLCTVTMDTVTTS